MACQHVLLLQLALARLTVESVRKKGLDRERDEAEAKQRTREVPSDSAEMRWVPKLGYRICVLRDVNGVHAGM